MLKIYNDLITRIAKYQIRTKQELHREKIRLCKKYNLRKIPPDSKILENISHSLSREEKERILRLLRKKPVRSLSGVAVVAVMTSPAKCPHGKCIPCPGGIETNTPQSYTGYEPAAMRAKNNNYDPYLQTVNRIDQLRAIGHSTDKIDFIVMGGTFTARDFHYQEWFIKRCYDGMNRCESGSLEEAKKINENASSRCIGLTIETRPDWCRMQHIDRILQYGATRIELGVQTIYDDVLYKMGRGHTVLDSILATRLAKDSGLKVCYHMMVGLPGSDIKKDLESFKIIFQDPRFKPDMIKIYPTLVIKGTKLYEMWKSGEYEALTEEELIPLIAKIKSFVPEWVRIQRIERDIPSPRIEAGAKESNLRQIVKRWMEENGMQCRCIRCREVGHIDPEEEVDPADVELKRIDYEASEGKEIFLSLEHNELDAIVGYLRLRLPGRPHREELQDGGMIVRELKVVGRALPIGERAREGAQHKGFGESLLKEAERISKEEFDCEKIFVLSGVGAKNYYRKLGYTDDGVYMRKDLT